MACAFLFGIAALVSAVLLFNVATNFEGYGQLATETMRDLMNSVFGWPLDEYHAYVGALMALAGTMIISIVIAWRSYINEARM